METINIQPIIEKIYRNVQKRRLAPGSYARLPEGNLPNPYGCADAANILYTIGAFPRNIEERAEFVRILGSMQNPETGLFVEDTSDPVYKNLHIHDPVHTTAHCMAALELFDAQPLYRAYALEDTLEPEGFTRFMEGIDYRGNPWSGSHRPAGLYVALNLGGSDTEEFNKRYFQWMWDNADPDTGLWRIGCQDGTRPLWEHMAGSFHYLFNHEHAHMPLRYPDKLIDSCIHMYRNIPRPSFGRMVGFMEIDWVYCMTRAMEQTPHRFYEAKECLEEFAVSFVSYLGNEDWDANHDLNDLHMLFGSVCALAELQRALRGKLYSKIPLKLVLDRRPFI